MEKWLKGKSGNPDGRRATAQLKRLAQAQAEASVATLVNVRDDAKAPPSVRFGAAALLIELAGRKVLPLDAAA
jgi:hypothetical protein